MIESKYWKEDLKILVKDLSPKRNPKRISGKALAVMEKRIVICFLIIRKLMEAKSKLTQAIYKYKDIITYYPVKADARITKLNDIFLERHYDLDSPREKKVDIRFICNQLIHNEIFFLVRDENRNYYNVLVCSEYEQRKALYEISIETISKILLVVADNKQESIIYTFDDRLGDYVISSK
ncbi:hypothetical protein LEP1GSC058_0848 [Leptospira fainei serovar Hurstbridge str. BUT 6]|uniref:Uncharacterized protein n=1 Tax=Leptospira fainei serovar Hurstbridge str. BUT 6 TaxID=1193011 RepID=S3UWL3_9LEPT|nr:hypothetical protein [Leptospira fainei]EPG72749.1 hypothetical protein LEP1GSC058_0848 [Leptospira fainei serovar Hurstbridge str. BUT 6]